MQGDGVVISMSRASYCFENSLVRVKVHLGGLAANVQIVRELALEPLGALACLVVLTQHRLGVNACRQQDQDLTK